MGEKAKSLGLAGVVGLLVGMGVVYWLRPLNSGAIGLVLLLTTSASVAIGGLVRRSRAKSKEGGDEKR